MSDKNLTVIAQVKAKEGMVDDVKKELFKLMGPTRSESGCMVYDLYQSADDEHNFMFYEYWRSKGDLDTHLGKPYIKSFMEETGEMLAGPVGVSLWKKISGV